MRPRDQNRSPQHPLCKANAPSSSERQSGRRIGARVSSAKPHGLRAGLRVFDFSDDAHHWLGRHIEQDNRCLGRSRAFWTRGGISPVVWRTLTGIVVRRGRCGCAMGLLRSKDALDYRSYRLAVRSPSWRALGRHGGLSTEVDRHWLVWTPTGQFVRYGSGRRGDVIGRRPRHDLRHCDPQRAREGQNGCRAEHHCCKYNRSGSLLSDYSLGFLRCVFAGGLWECYGSDRWRLAHSAAEFWW